MDAERASDLAAAAGVARFLAAGAAAGEGERARFSVAFLGAGAGAE